MRVTVGATAQGVRDRLLALIHECGSFSWAAAWATDNDVVQAAIKARKKMARLVIGTHHYITDPSVLRQCLGMRNVRVRSPDGHLFHPKVYAFDLGDRLEVYVGSSNLTSSGLPVNTECGVFLNAEHDNEELQSFLDYVEGCWDGGEVISESFLLSYEANRARTADAWSEIRRFVKVKPPLATTRSATRVAAQAMSWSEFAQRVRDDRHIAVASRLDMLSHARELAARRFDSLTETQRRCVAGLLKPLELNGVDWGTFGQMSAHGKYYNVLRDHYRVLAEAMEQIPVAGPVTRRDYDRYLSIFKSVPGASSSWKGMGTRLLAMRRPDQFVCLDRANVRGICGYLGAAFSTINLDNYWDNIIEQVRLTPWYRADMPKRPQEKQIWEGRTAMLDAIYYDPHARRG